MAGIPRHRSRRFAALSSVFVAVALGCSGDDGGPLDFVACRGAQYLVVGATGSPAIAVLGVAPDGALSTVPGSPFPTGLASLGLAITPDGEKVYSAHTGSGTV